MSFNFLVIVAILGAISVVAAVEGPAVAKEERKFTPEDDCSRVGGICLPRESCPPEKISEEGQCPSQRSLGAVCCHSVSMTESRCEQLGGHCRESCPETLIIARANDCSEGEKCCPLV